MNAHIFRRRRGARVGVSASASGSVAVMQSQKLAAQGGAANSVVMTLAWREEWNYGGFE